jgi:hypothetical protein
VTYDGFWEGMLISMKEVAIGVFSKQNVDFIAYDIPQVARYDVILGKSFLTSTELSIDYAASSIRIGGGGRDR